MSRKEAGRLDSLPPEPYSFLRGGGDGASAAERRKRRAFSLQSGGISPGREPDGFAGHPGALRVSARRRGGCAVDVAGSVSPARRGARGHGDIYSYLDSAAAMEHAAAGARNLHRFLPHRPHHSRYDRRAAARNLPASLVRSAARGEPPALITRSG
jgi:hypothetical protein